MQLVIHPTTLPIPARQMGGVRRFRNSSLPSSLPSSFLPRSQHRRQQHHHLFDSTLNPHPPQAYSRPSRTSLLPSQNRPHPKSTLHYRLRTPVKEGIVCRVWRVFSLLLGGRLQTVQTRGRFTYIKDAREREGGRERGALFGVSSDFSMCHVERVCEIVRGEHFVAEMCSERIFFWGSSANRIWPPALHLLFYIAHFTRGWWVGLEMVSMLLGPYLPMSCVVMYEWIWHVHLLWTTSNAGSD